MSSPAHTSSSDQVLSRQSWVSACHFHDLTEKQVLAQVASRVAALKERGHRPHPLVLLDLDSTLYEVGPRTHQILKEWAASSESAEFPAVRSKFETFSVSDVGYSVRDTFQALGFDLTATDVLAAIESAKGFWTARFFTSGYLKYDRAYPGAAEFTRKVHESGAEIVYLTGRDEPMMGEGTRECLIRDGFPWNVDKTHLLLKKAAHLEDLSHKKEAADYIRQHGTLVASFENEPPNLIALCDIFPEAMHVFVDTVCSDHGAQARQGLYRIRGFDHP